jgi:hypothetical protein
VRHVQAAKSSGLMLFVSCANRAEHNAVVKLSSSFVGQASTLTLINDIDTRRCHQLLSLANSVDNTKLIPYCDLARRLMATLTLAIYGGGYASRGFIIKLIEYDSSNIHKLHAVAINFIREIIVFFHTLFA